MAKHRCSSPRWLAMLAVLAVGTVVEGQRAPFRSGVALVPLTVTVTDGRGEYVNDLSRHHFTVLEDGVPQSLAFFASEPVPVDLALVLDVSGSMRQHLPIVRRAASGLIRSLRAGDRVTVAALDNSITVVQPLTDDLVRADGATREMAANGKTALYDGLYVMLGEIQQERRRRSDVRRQAMVVLSDGLDTASHLGFDDVMSLAQRVGVSIYVVAVPGPRANRQRAEQDADVLKAGFELRALARQAGGRAFFPQSMRDLPEVYGDIARELANQYELAYLPSASVGDGAFRRVTVRVHNAVARTRSGYVASATAATPAAIATTHSSTGR
jgi:Ca-activated chloride channel homolog